MTGGEPGPIPDAGPIPDGFVPDAGGGNGDGSCSPLECGGCEGVCCCDAACVAFGDCCPDACAVCGAC